MRERVLIVGVVLWLLACSACSMERCPAQPVPDTEPYVGLADGAWPARETEGLPRFASRQSVQIDLSQGAGTLDLTMSAQAGPRGMGWIYEVGLRSGDESILSSVPVWFEYLSWRPGATRPSFEAVPEGAALLVGEKRAALAESADYHQKFTLTLPDRGEPVGLVIHAFSLSSSRNELAVTEAMRKRGWAVLHTTRLIFRAEDGPKRERPEGTEPSSTVATPEDQLRELGRGLEALLADYAFAAEAATDYALERRPSLGGKPIVVMGFSFGAILAPTVAARLGDRIRAVVLVAGGADFLGIVTESPVSRWIGLFTSARASVGAVRFAELDSEYRGSAVLDPYSTAMALRGTPVLQVHAAWDSIVPATYCDLLWERLGRPERWVFRGGHVPLFWNMSNYSDQIAEWVERAVWPAK